MIRLATLDDKKALMAIAEAINLFSPQELEELGGMLTEYFDSLDSTQQRDHYWLTYDDGEPVGVAYYAPEPYTEGTWNLYFIAVHPSRQGEGIGT
ncbi:MAG: GNAT family N-acetyltransferase, partial [Symploca sp. SIO2E6]|nr:GNAT family N-acetyltransferase [Symploca sp. SIO2E6]